MAKTTAFFGDQKEFQNGEFPSVNFKLD